MICILQVEMLAVKQKLGLNLSVYGHKDAVNPLIKFKINDIEFIVEKKDLLSALNVLN